MNPSFYPSNNQSNNQMNNNGFADQSMNQFDWPDDESIFQSINPTNKQSVDPYQSSDSSCDYSLPSPDSYPVNHSFDQTINQAINHFDGSFSPSTNLSNNQPSHQSSINQSLVHSPYLSTSQSSISISFDSFSHDQLLVDQSINHLIDHTMDQRSKQAVHSSMNHQPVYQSINQPIHNSIDEPMCQPVNPPMSQSFSQPPYQSINQSINQPVHHIIPSPISHSIHQTINQPTYQSINQSNNQFCIQSNTESYVQYDAARPLKRRVIDQSTNQPVNRSFNRSPHQTHSQSINQYVDHSNKQAYSMQMNQPINQAYNQYVNHPVNQSSNRPVVHSVNQPVNNQTISQANSQSNSQVINQSNNKSIKNQVWSEAPVRALVVSQAIDLTEDAHNPNLSIKRSISESNNQSINQSVKQTDNQPTILSKREKHRLIDQKRRKREQDVFVKLTELINEINLSINQTDNQSINETIGQLIKLPLPAHPDRVQLLEIACDYMQSMFQSINQTTQTDVPSFHQAVSHSINQSINQTIKHAIPINPINQSNNQLIHSSVLPLIHLSKSCTWRAMYADTGELIDLDHFIKHSILQPFINQSNNQSINQSIRCLGMTSYHWKLISVHLEMEYAQYLATNRSNKQSNNQTVSQSISYTPHFHLTLPPVSVNKLDFRAASDDPYLTNFMSELWSLFINQSNNQSINQSNNQTINQVCVKVQGAWWSDKYVDHECIFMISPIDQSNNQSHNQSTPSLMRNKIVLMGTKPPLHTYIG